MSDIKQANIGATAADTFHENGLASFSHDEETGVANTNNAHPSSTAAAPAQRKSYTGWIVWSIALVVVIALAVGLSTKGGNDDDSNVASSKAGDVATVPAEPSTIDEIIVDNATNNNGGGVNNDIESITSDDGEVAVSVVGGSNPFIPEQDVGDAALLNPNLPEAAALITSTDVPSSSPTTSPSAAPVTNEPSAKPSNFDPTLSPTPPPSGTPTPEPTGEPSMEPTAGPSKSPTDEPTSLPSTNPSSSPTTNPSAEPSKTPTLSPTSSPTMKPTNRPINFAAWANLDWNFEPTISPSNSPTLEPTKIPTAEPTNAPSKSPTSSPTNEPTKTPTPVPTSEPTNKPTPAPTSEPTEAPTKKPTPSPTQNPVTDSPTERPTLDGPFFFGDDWYTDKDLGINISKGLTARLIARTDMRVKYANGNESKRNYHTKSDAAGIIPMDPNDPTGDAGYAYVTNSEEGDGDGGVYAIYFDKDGEILEYKSLLTGTTDNCGGGISPWNTFISCEEFSGGQCWEVDPVNERFRKTRLGGSGGRYESVAVDNRRPENPVFFTTEDHEEGAMRRFVADGNGWGALHSGGDTSYLNMLGNGRFEWTNDEGDARDSAADKYPNTEGVQFHDGKLYFMAKKIQKLIILDLDNMTYKTEDTGKKFYGEGTFGNQPDQNLFGPTRKLMYFTEDGGTSPGVYARSGEDGAYGGEGTYFTIFESIRGGMHSDDETIGIALSPDHKRFYAGIQHNGYIFEFTRDDGLTFE